MKELEFNLVENYTWWLNKWREIKENDKFKFLQNYKKENAIISLYYNLTNIESRFNELKDCILYKDMIKVKKIIDQRKISELELIIYENLQRIKSYNYK